jgi:flagellar biosynthetic protein FliO
MDVIREMTAAAAVLALLGLALWALKRRGLAAPPALRRGGGRRLECVQRVALGPQHALHLVRLDERGLLLSSSPSGCALIESFPWREAKGEREAAR